MCTQRKRVLKRKFYCDPEVSKSKTVYVAGFRYNLRVKPTRRLRLELDAAAALYAAVALEYGRNSPIFNVFRVGYGKFSP